MPTSRVFLRVIMYNDICKTFRTMTTAKFYYMLANIIKIGLKPITHFSKSSVPSGY